MNETKVLYETAKILIERIEKANTMQEIWLTYKEVSINLHQNADINIEPFFTKDIIGELSIICNRIGLPLISCIVINGDELEPGKGFFKLYGDLAGRKLKKEDSDLIWLEESKKCFECKNWDELLITLNPHHEAKLKVHRIMPISNKKFETNENKVENDKKIYEEGKEILRQHIKLEKERNPLVIKDAKIAFLKKHGRVYCEICGFDFSKAYGELGKNFIEGHHKKMVAAMDKEGDTITIDDIAIVCCNCHAMLHRRIPPISVERLKGIIEQNRGNY